MAAKKSSRKPQGNYMDDFAKAILGALKAGGKATKPAQKKPLGNLSGVEKSFGGRYKRTAPPSPPKRTGTNQAAPRPSIQMRPQGPPQPPKRTGDAVRPAIPMRPRPPQPPAKQTKPAFKAKPMPKKQAVKPATKRTPSKRRKGMEK
jgi:hypothetical protein